MSNKKYVIIDLEMCNVPRSKRSKKYCCRNEIIEIGAALIDEDLKIVDTFQTYVSPEFGVLDDFIKNLTGINDSDIADAPVIKEAIENFVKWIPEDATIVSWSESDKHQILKELNSKEIDSPLLGGYIENWEDCQKEFSEKMNSSKIYNLSEALIIADIQFDENIHDGLVDAENTALLFIKMKKETSLKLSPYYSSDSSSEIPTYRPFANLLMNFKCV